MEEEMIQLAAQYIECRHQILEIKEEVCPVFPVKPISATLKDWEIYKEKKLAYDSCVNRKGEGLEKKEQNLKALKLNIISLLPESNMWFLFANKVLAIGHRTNDWPSSDGDLYVLQNPLSDELKKLRHQIVD